MKRQELKNLLAVVEGAERNIEGWQALKNRELAIIPTDSNYYKAFEEWKKDKNGIYDGKQEKAPSYISGKKAGEVLDLLIKHQEDFMKTHKQKLDKALAT